MARGIAMESRGVRYHQVQKAVEAFVESELKTASIKDVKWTEWSTQNSCYRSFSRAIKNLGYDNCVRVIFRNDGRIIIVKFPHDA